MVANANLGSSPRRHDIQLLGGEQLETAIFIEEDAGPVCRLFCIRGGMTIEADAPDYFDALRMIRGELERERIIPFCYGASIDVCPSLEQRTADRGRLAQKLVMGQDPRPEDVVEIFDVGSNVIPGFMAMQDEYLEDWLVSVEE